MVDLLAALAVGEPALAAEQRARGVRRRARLAERGAAGQARLALAAGGDEREDDVVARRERGHALAESDDLAGGLVAERHRHHPRPAAVDDREVGVAEARRPHLDQQLARARRVELELDDLQRPRLGVGGRRAHLAQDRAADLHDRRSRAGLQALEARRAAAPASSPAVSSPRRRTRARTSRSPTGSSAPAANRPIS